MVISNKCDNLSDFIFILVPPMAEKGLIPPLDRFAMLSTDSKFHKANKNTESWPMLKLLPE
jgi:hypothetical protein